MRIVVSSASTCKILAGSFIYSEIKGAKASRDAINTLELIKGMYKTTDFEDGRILRVTQDIADIKVADCCYIVLWPCRKFQGFQK